MQNWQKQSYQVQEREWKKASIQKQQVPGKKFEEKKKLWHLHGCHITSSTPGMAYPTKLSWKESFVRFMKGKFRATKIRERGGGGTGRNLTPTVSSVNSQFLRNERMITWEFNFLIFDQKTCQIARAELKLHHWLSQEFRSLSFNMIVLFLLFLWATEWSWFSCRRKTRWFNCISKDEPQQSRYVHMLPPFLNFFLKKACANKGFPSWNTSCLRKKKLFILLPFEKFFSKHAK